MGLRAQAEADLSSTLEAPGDFGFPFTLTDPAGFTSVVQLHGQTGDIGTVIDVDTGLLVSGRLGHLSCRISTLTANGYTSLPVSVADSASKPWVVSFDDLEGNTQLWKVQSSRPDRTLGVITLILEFWQVAP